jgi:hypothetical protein
MSGERRNRTDISGQWGEAGSGVWRSLIQPPRRQLSQSHQPLCLNFFCTIYISLLNIFDITMPSSLASAVARRSANSVLRTSSTTRSSLIFGSRNIQIASPVVSRRFSTERYQLPRATHTPKQRLQSNVNHQQRRKYSSENASGIKSIGFDDVRKPPIPTLSSVAMKMANHFFLGMN